MDVKYIPSDWEKMRGGIKELIGYGVYGKGMFEDLKKLNEVLEDAETDIAKYDVDGAISFSHTSQKSTYLTMFEKFEVLYRFTGKVGNIVDRTIDQPFYEDMDAFVSAMEEATISKYKTTNRIGATELKTFGYGTATVMEVPKTEVSMDDLLSGGNFYGDQMKLEYEEWKKVNPDQDLSQSEYQLAALNMHAFEYESIRDHQENKEFWVQIGALVVIGVVSFVFLPAGLTLGAIYGTLELSSAVSGKDWVSDRELGTGERWFRGLLAPLDILPAAAAFTKFANNVRNIGRITDNLGDIAVKSGAKEGIQQGLGKVDHLVEEAAKEVPSRLKSADAAIDDQFSDHALKAVVGDEFNLAKSSSPSPSLNIPSTRKMNNLADDMIIGNQVVKENVVSKVEMYTYESIKEIINSRGYSVDEFSKLLHPDRVLNDQEKVLVDSVRNEVGIPPADTVMTKIIPQSDIYKYLYNEYTGVRGFTAVKEHGDKLKTLYEKFEGARLDYNTTAFKTTNGVDGISISNGDPDRFYGTIEYNLIDNEKLSVPNWEATADSYPYTGKGFTGSKNVILPEYYQAERKFIAGDILNIVDSESGDIISQFDYSVEFGWVLRD